MTREEEIKYASKDYVNYLLDKQEYRNENYTEDDIRQALVEGAKWADTNPKSPWISVEDDLPCNHEELLNAKCQTKEVFILRRGGFPDVDYMLKTDGKWIWFEYKSPEFWMPILEVSKE